jgi:transcription elongation factor Elf1
MLQEKVIPEYVLDCPFCGMEVTTTEDHLMKNSRVCCMHCNKAFQVDGSIQETEEDDYNKHQNGGYYGD